MSTVIPVEENVAHLRRALRTGDSSAIDRAAAPLISLLWSPLVSQARRLVHSSWRPLGLEGEDLVQDAWLRVLTYLVEPAGESVRTGEHLQRLLSRMIRQRFLDAVDRAEGRDDQDFEEEKAEQLAEPSASASAGLDWLEDGPRQQLMGALFESEEAFLSACTRKPRRRRRHYQAYVLFTLASFYQSEGVASPETAALFGRYIVLLGVAAKDWEALEHVAAAPGAGDAQLFEAVNGLCGTTLTGRADLYGLRYELGQLVGER
jgi:DNA-directed RNA polymerase specialized sigma24 family protein